MGCLVRLSVGRLASHSHTMIPSTLRTGLSGISFSLLIGLALLSACSSPTSKAPIRQGALSTYHNLEQVDETTWRYLNRPRLATYQKFIVQPVKVLVRDLEGRTIRDESRRAASEYMRQAVEKALGDRYPLVTSASTDTAEIVITLSEAFKRGTHLGLSVEGEIRDSYSGVQVAAVVKSALGPSYVGEWWNQVSAKQVMDAWAAQLRKTLDESR